MLVKDWMTEEPLVVSPKTSVEEAIRIMRENRVRHLPVVKKDDQLVGIVTQTDLLQASPSPATSLSVWEINFLLAKMQVRDAMTRKVIVVEEECPLEEAALVMAEHKIGCLPVVHGQAPGGHHHRDRPVQHLYRATGRSQHRRTADAAHPRRQGRAVPPCGPHRRAGRQHHPPDHPRSAPVHDLVIRYSGMCRTLECHAPGRADLAPRKSVRICAKLLAMSASAQSAADYPGAPGRQSGCHPRPAAGSAPRTSSAAGRCRPSRRPAPA